MGGLPSAEGHKVPGLISREIIDADDETVTIREVWDPKAPGCPLLVFERYTFPFKDLSGEVATVTHTFKCPHYGDRPQLSNGER